MKRAMSLLFLAAFLATSLMAKGRAVDLYGLCRIELPPEFELVGTSAASELETSKGRYGLSIYLEFIYEGWATSMTLTLYSWRGPLPLPEAVKKIKPREYAGETWMAIRFDALKAEAKTHPFDLGGGRRGARLASEWSSGVSADYLGYLIPAKGSAFDESYFSVHDAWQALGSGDLARGLSPLAFDALLARQSKACAAFYMLMDGVARSFAPSASGADLAIAEAEFRQPGYLAPGAVLTPTISDLRYRDGPGRSAPVLGKLPKLAHLVVLQRGAAETIDGVAGSWVRVLMGMDRWRKVAWVFDGYLRKMTQAELDAEFSGDF